MNDQQTELPEEQIPAAFKSLYEKIQKWAQRQKSEAKHLGKANRYRKEVIESIKLQFINGPTSDYPKICISCDVQNPGLVLKVRPCIAPQNNRFKVDIFESHAVEGGNVPRYMAKNLESGQNPDDVLALLEQSVNEFETEYRKNQEAVELNKLKRRKSFWGKAFMTVWVSAVAVGMLRTHFSEKAVVESKKSTFDVNSTNKSKNPKPYEGPAWAAHHPLF